MKPPPILTMATIPALVALTLTIAPTYAGTHHGAARSTDFAFKSSGYGTRVIGGQAHADSSTSGYRAIGCTNQAGRSRTNNVAEATLPGLGKASNVRTRVWTTSHNGVFASHSMHKIGRLSLVQSSLGSLSLSSIVSRATASHDSSGFHATTQTLLGGITFAPVIGPAQTFPAPTPDQPLTIPGLATIYAGQHTTRQSGTGATANAFALRIDMAQSGSSVRIAHSHAEINSGMTAGVFHGRSAASHVVQAVDGVLKGGPNPLATMPCQGTYGKTHEKSVSLLDLGSQLLVKGGNALERGSQSGDQAHGVSRGKVSRMSLGGQLVVDDIVGKVTVTRQGGHLTTSTKGTKVGTVTIAGHTQTFPKTGVLEIPGVVKLERAVVTRTHSGISVIGLRITLLDGTGAVVNLGEASLKIGRLAH